MSFKGSGGLRDAKGAKCKCCGKRWTPLAYRNYAKSVNKGRLAKSKINRDPSFSESTSYAKLNVSKLICGPVSSVGVGYTDTKLDGDGVYKFFQLIVGFEFVEGEFVSS
jgi:hypothetical protein